MRIRNEAHLKRKGFNYMEDLIMILSKTLSAIIQFSSVCYFPSLQSPKSNPEIFSSLENLNKRLLISHPRLSFLSIYTSIFFFSGPSPTMFVKRQDEELFLAQGNRVAVLCSLNASFLAMPPSLPLPLQLETQKSTTFSLTFTVSSPHLSN